MSGEGVARELPWILDVAGPRSRPVGTDANPTSLGGASSRELPGNLLENPGAPMTRTEPTIRTIRVAPGRVLTPSPVFDTYWRFAAKRQEVFMRRVSGASRPWTDDPILAEHRFTNAYRAADRVSQYLIRHVLYEGDQQGEEVFFRALLFKFFNRIETWEELVEKLGVPTWSAFEPERTARVMDSMLARGETIYSAAYIMPSPDFGCARKHRNHLRLLEHMMRDAAPQRVAGAKSLEQVFQILKSYPSLGDFLAFQFAIDLNYSRLIDFSEMDFVAAGPGARDGIRKCFASTGGLSDAELIRTVAERADEEFRRLGLSFEDLWGRPLQLVDCQNLFCEVDKYARVAHPDARGQSGRTRIKQRYTARPDPLPQWYPPKWNLSRFPPALDAEVVRPKQLPLQRVERALSSDAGFLRPCGPHLL